jgi:hypothetical protein
MSTRLHRLPQWLPLQSTRSDWEANEAPRRTQESHGSRAGGVRRVARVYHGFTGREIRSLTGPGSRWMAHAPAAPNAIMAYPRMQRSLFITLYATGVRRAELTTFHNQRRLRIEKTALSDGHDRYLLNRLPLGDLVDGVRGQLNELLVQPAWPSDLDLFHNGIRSESEMQAGIIC